MVLPDREQRGLSDGSPVPLPLPIVCEFWGKLAKVGAGIAVSCS
jgi:hypothetical protein